MDEKEKSKNFEIPDSDSPDFEDLKSYKYKNEDQFIFFQITQFVQKVINQDFSLSHIKQEVISVTMEKIKKLESVMLPLIGEYKRKINDFWFSDKFISFPIFRYKNRVKIRVYSRFYEAFIMLLKCRNIITSWVILLVGVFFLLFTIFILSEILYENLVCNLNFYLYLSVLLTYIRRLLIFTILIVLLGFMFVFMNKLW